MELQLKKVEHGFYESMTLHPFYCETMRENIVPDSCADIARIVDTSGVVCLTGREMTGDNRFCASGTVEVSVLYIPEKGEGPCSLHFQLPFQCYGEGQDGENCRFPDLRGELQNIDTRLLNPRKVLTRANLVLYPSGCREISMSLCTQTMEEDNSIQLLHQRRETRVIAGIKEKEFSFMEELPLSPGRGSAEEILTTRLEIRGTDSKLIGNKLVVKGLISAAVLYREEKGTVNLLQQELPFSQIMDGAGLEESWDSEASYCLLGAECRTGNGDGAADAHMMTLTVQIRARVTVWRKEEIDFIADLYSISQPISCHMKEIELQEDSQRQNRRISGRETLETGVAVKSIVDTALDCGTPRLTSDGMQLEIPLRAKCLYWDENDMLRSVNKEFSLSCPAETEEGMSLDAAAASRGDVMTSILPEGVELRFPVECALQFCRRSHYLCVSGGETMEEERESDRRPSVVLRKFAKNEILWSVAKQYRTTCRAIMEVNDISDERQIPTDRLLLIPRARA